MAPRSKKSPSRRPKARFSSIALVVASRTRSRRWYTEKLGLDLVQDMDHWVTVGRRGVPGLIHLCQTSEIGMRERPHPGLSGIALKIPGDFEAGCAALKSNGVRFRKGPTEEAWGWWAGVVDPDGNEITLLPDDT